MVFFFYSISVLGLRGDTFNQALSFSLLTRRCVVLFFVFVVGIACLAAEPSLPPSTDSTLHVKLGRYLEGSTAPAPGFSLANTVLNTLYFRLSNHNI